MDFWDYVPAAWQAPLTPVKGQIQSISRQLEGTEFLPEAQLVFRALEIAPSQVQVLIVGQDPYPNPLYACGLSFSVPPGTKPLPGSLRNILQEVSTDVGPSIVIDGDLQSWANQGVMLLNRVLSVEPGAPLSHHQLGWQVVTDRIIDEISQQSPQAIALLWGKQAQTLADRFLPTNVMLGVHPSPLSAHRGFLGSKPFSRINQIRRARQQEPIRW